MNHNLQFFRIIIFLLITNIVLGKLCVENYVIIENDTINHIDTNCIKIGLWVENYDYQSRNGYYKDGKENGVWELINSFEHTKEIGVFDDGNKNGMWKIYSTTDHKILKEEIYRNGILVKEIDINEGIKKVVLSKTSISYFMEKYLNIILILLFIPYLIRVILNNIILNKINNTKYCVFYAPIWKYYSVINAYECMLRCYWFKNELLLQDKSTIILMRICNFTFHIQVIIILLLASNKLFEVLIV